MSIFRKHQQDSQESGDYVEPGTCMYGYHRIPDGEPYVTVSWMRERFDGQAVDVDYAAVLLFACLAHAPSEGTVSAILAAAGIPA